MTIFDAPTRESCIARRERTNTPLQALVLMNEELYFHAARHYARQLLAMPDTDDASRLSYAYESITCHPPDATELRRLCETLDGLRAEYRCDAESVQAMMADEPEVRGEDRVEIAAHTVLVNSLFNLDITKTRE
jgi:hypothetical protein